MGNPDPEKSYVDYLAEFDTVRSDDALIAFIDERVVAALPQGWSVATPDEVERRRHTGIQDYQWNLYEGDRTESDYILFPVDRKRIAFVYGNRPSGAFRMVRHSMHRSLIIPTPLLAPALALVFAESEEFPTNQWDLT